MALSDPVDPAHHRTERAVSSAMSSAVSGAVIAGGRSRRLGSDKRLLQVEGIPLLARTVATLRPLVSDLHVIVASDTDREVVARALGHLADDVTVQIDARPGQGPTAGLEVALDVADGEHVLVVAADHPHLHPDVLRLLVSRARSSDALAVALGGPYGAEPLLAVYRTSALATVRAQLDAGVLRLQAVLAALGPSIVSYDEWRAHDPSGRTLHDIDGPEDLAT
jgi:molybdenum cofactor guanylyltransferase